MDTNHKDYKKAATRQRARVSRSSLLLASVLLLSASLPGALLAGPTSAETRETTTPEARNGILDLRQWDFERDGSAKLSGDWKLVWSQFTSPNRPLRNAHAARVPRSWDQLGIEGVGGRGFGTFQLVLQGLPDTGLMISLPSMTGAYRLYCGDSLIASTGTAGSSFETTIPKRIPRLAALPPNCIKDSGAVLTWHVANFRHRTGGGAAELTSTMTIGLPAQMMGSVYQRHLSDLSLLAIAFIMGLYHLVFWLFRRNDIQLILFSAVASLFCVRIIGTQTLLQQAFPAADFYEFEFMLEYLGYYLLVPVFFSYLRAWYPREFNRIVSYALWTVAALFSATVLFGPVDFYSNFIRYYESVSLAAFLYTLIALGIAIARKHRGAWIISAGVWIIIGTATHDILGNMGVLQSETYLAQFGFLTFLLSQSSLMAALFSDAFRRAEDLSENLEKKVVSRTEELAREKDHAETARATALAAQSESEILADLAQQANRGTDARSLLEPLAQILISRLGADRLGLWLAREDGYLHLVAGYSDGSPTDPGQYSDIVARISTGEEGGILARGLREGRTIYTPRVNQKYLESSPVDREIQSTWNFDWFVNIPLLVQQRSVGLIAASGPKAQRIPKTEIKFLERAAATVAGATQKQSLLERIEAEKNQAESLRIEAEREKEESELLAELARETNQGASIEELLAPIYRASRSRIGARNIALYLADESNRILKLRASYSKGRSDTPADYPEILQDVPVEDRDNSLIRTYLRGRSNFQDRMDPEILKEYPVDQALYEQWNYDWAAIVPLTIKGQSMGLIVWSGEGKNQISRSDLPFLESVADIITGAIHNLQLLEQVKEKQSIAEQERQATEMLAELSRKAMEGGKLEEIVRSLSDFLRPMVGNHGVSLYLPDPEARLLVQQTASENGKVLPLDTIPDIVRNVPLASEGGSLPIVFGSGKPMYFARITQRMLDSSEVDRAVADHFKLQWVYHLPLSVGDKVIGIATIGGRYQRRIPPSDKALIGRMIAQVAGAVQQQSLLQTIEEEKDSANKLEQETRALAEFTRLLNERQDLDSVVKEVCRFAVEALDLRGTFITVINEKEREFQNIGGFGRDYNDQQLLFATGSRAPLNPDAGTYYRTYERKKPLYFRRLPQLDNPTDRYVVELLELKSYAHVPLILQGNVIGIMGVDPGQRKLKREDLNRLQRYADQVTGAINNAALLKQVQQQRFSIEGMAKITEVAASTDNLDEIIDQIFDYVRQRYGILSGIVMLPDDKHANLRTYRVVTFEDKDKLQLHEVGRYSENLSIPINDRGGTLARTFRRGRPFYVPDASRIQNVKRNYPGAETDREIFSNLRYKGYLALPMSVNNEPVALLNFTSYGGELRLSKSDREELGTLADQLAGIIRSRQLADRLAIEKKRAEQEKKVNEALANLARQANEGAGIEDILTQTSRYVQSECGVSRLGLYIVNHERNTLELHSILESAQLQNLEEAPEIIKTIPIEFESGSLATVVRRNRKFFMPYMKQQFLEASHVDKAHVEFHKFDWALQAPLNTSGSIIGILVFVGPHSTRPGLRERQLMERIVDQIAGAVQSKQLLDQVREARKDSEALAELARRADEGADLTEIGELVLHYARERCGVDTMGLYTVDREHHRMEAHAIARKGVIEPVRAVPEELRFPPLAEETGSLSQVVARGKPLYMGRLPGRVKIRMSDHDRKNLEFMGFDWFLDIPMIAQEEVIGVIAFAGPARQKLSKSERSFLERITVQVAGSVQNRQLLKQVESERNVARTLQKETEGLNQLLKRIAAMEDLEAIMDEVIAFSEEAYGIGIYSLYSVDNATKQMQALAMNFPDHIAPEDRQYIMDTPVPLDFRGGAFTTAYRRSPRYTYFKNAKSEGTSPIEQFVTETYNLTNMVVYPLMEGDQVMAFLNFLTYTEEGLNRDQLSQLSILSDQISGIIRMNGLIRQVKEQSARTEAARQEVEALARITRKANESADLEQIFDIILSYAQENFGIEGAMLQLADANANELFYYRTNKVARHTDDMWDFMQNLRIPLDESGGLAHNIARRGKPMYLLDMKRAALELSDPLKKLVKVVDLKSALIVPLKVKHQTIGMMYFSNYSSRLQLNRDQINSIARFAEQIAGTIYGANLLEQAETERARAEAARKETEILADLSRKANEATDLEAVSQTLFDYLRESLELDDFCLFVLEPETMLLHAAAWDTTAAHDPENLRWLETTRFKLEPEIGTLYRTYTKKKSTYLPRFPEAFFAEGDRAIVEKLKLTSALQVPLIIQDEVIGFFTSGPRRRLSREEITSVERFCNQVAGAIRATALLNSTVQARQRAEAARQETEALAMLAKQANETSNLQSLCDTLFDHLEKHYSIHNQALFVVHTESHEMTPVAARGGRTEQQRQQWLDTFRINLSRDPGTLSSTYKRQKTFYIKEIPKTLAGKDLEIVNTLNPGSILQVPLVLQGHTVAIMVADPIKALNRSDISSIERLCDQIAGAVRTTALLQATQEAREEAVAAKEEAEVARAESDALLENVLPSVTAKELKESGRVEPVYFDNVSVLFTDFVGFTKAAANLSPAELIQELDGCFSQFDEVSRRNNMEKLKTIGDAYMCAGGLPVPNEGHAIDACLTALEFRSFMNQMAAVKGQLGYEFWQIRIGIHSGPVTAGVIGQNKFSYDIWGDTVNVASRMESSGSPGMVNISGTTYELVKDLFECEYRGKVQAKGKGELDMYFVHRIKPELSADEEGLLPNAMFELARTDMDMEELDDLRRNVAARKAEGFQDGVSTDSRDHSEPNGSFDLSNALNPSNRPNSASSHESPIHGPSSGTRHRKKKLAGARPLSDIDESRQGW
ncbi:MAG: GAF domain-containing protein [Leptospiraceae bacterium]